MSSSISSSEAPWRRFLVRLLATAAGGLALVYAFVVLVDPWGVLPLSIPAERTPVSTNARYAFPGLARAPRFDAAIVGTSTSRMLRPEVLNPAFGARFVNLAMNAATAWEQSQLIEVFLRAHPRPTALIVGLDHVWCEAGLQPRLTPRPFPAAFYAPQPWAAYREMLSVYAVQEAGRQFAVLTGLTPPRQGRDGFTRFLPPDGQYDAARAAAILAAPSLPVRRPAGDVDTMALLERMLSAVPAGTRTILAFMPLHRGAQATPGTAAADAVDRCKRRVAAMAATEANMLVLDFLRPSPITDEPTHYWDPMHFREGIADRVMAHLARAATGDPGPHGDYAVLRPPGP